MMFDLTEWLATSPYSLDKALKSERLTTVLSNLTQHHFETCVSYRNILNAVGYDGRRVQTCVDIPFLPVRLFKDIDLLSVPREEVVKTMTSSGTTGQAVSKIFLDRATSANQMKVLTKIVSSFIGGQRLPMLILDSPSVVKDRKMFSARAAGILGFSIFAADKAFALDDNMGLNCDVIDAFLEKHKGKNILLFGFTFMIWQHFYKELLKLGISYDLSRGILIHGGGWKKLANEAISSSDFRNRLNKICGIIRVHDYYGMVEQTGSIFMECEQGHLHASIFSDVIVRRSLDFSPVPFGERGIVEVLSLLPGSYPGHALLTEDEGVALGEDDCPCGRLGKYFKIFGRVKNAEVRGCSDTYTARFS
jgi:phenylacetate-coenzyme A ligase PaaK-like adenylate-forming protein